MLLQPELSLREEFIKNMFFPKQMDELAAIDLTKKISSIGDRFGFVGNPTNDVRRNHKYDVWIAGVVKKQLLDVSLSGNTILDKESELFKVLDWAIETGPNISAMSYDEALEKQKKWLKDLKKKGVVRPPPLDLERIVYRCKNGYFIYLLTADDLAYEAKAMTHCVNDGDTYKSAIRSRRSILVSLRDERNKPHVTIEVSLNKGITGKFGGTVLQQYGKENKPPVEKYHAALREFILYSNGAMTQDEIGFLSG